MRRNWMLGAALAVAVAAASSVARADEAFDRFKALAGDWVSAEDGEMVKKGQLVASYHVTGGGSAVVEELFAGSPHAMTTVSTSIVPFDVSTRRILPPSTSSA